MKKMRRILSIMLATMMVMAMGITASAGTITITNNQADELTYEAYQVIKGDVVTENGKTTFSNVEWGTGVDEVKFLPELNKVAGFESVKNAEEFVEALSKQTDDSAVMQEVSVAVSKALGTVAGTSTGTNPYTISGLENGYYFVRDINGLATAGTRDSKYAMIVVKDDSAKIEIKTDVPTQEKKVEENQSTNYTATDVERETYGEGFNDVADYNINDVVPFELISKVPNFKGSETYYYEFVDQMDAAFTFDPDSVEVFLTDADNINNVTRTLAKGTDYELRMPGYQGATFSIVIDDLVKTMTEAEIGQKIVVRFKATLNENAVIGRPGNRNKSKLRYGNNPNEQGKPTPKETPWDEVVVFTYELDATKVDSADAQKKLKDAEFVFYRDVNGTKEYVVVDANSKVQEWTTDETKASVLKSGDDGTFCVIGLDEGTYFLKETKAPTGYNLMKDEVKVEIIANTNNGHNGATQALIGTAISIDDGTPAHTPEKPVGIEGVDIDNKQGVELPETGGIGTTIFYVIGAALMIGAGVVLVTRRRMAK